MSDTTNQEIVKGSGYVAVTGATVSGLISFSTACQFATGQPGTPPASSLVGHGVVSNEPRRYSLSGNTIYVKANEDKSIFVIVDED